MRNYTHQIVEFEPSRPIKNEKIVSVKGTIKEARKPDITITFQVRRNKENQWKAFDLVAEGISMVQSKRAESAPIIRQEGIDTVIEFMQQKSIQQPQDEK